MKQSENTRETVSSELLGESFVRVHHSSGLEMRLCPMKGFASAFALLTVSYGSSDIRFGSCAEDVAEVPAGIAHFLEHKLFESEDGDAFDRFAGTGANANAYTSFDRTAYLFSCTDNFNESIEILFDFVTKPYFTPETVEKEQGIIAQEIKMYDDSADWRVMFNLLGAMYHKNPIRTDIAGTVESIAQIDDKLLYRCYNSFYDLSNMVLTVAGGFDIDAVLDAADRILPECAGKPVYREDPGEPEEVVTDYVEQKLTVAQPVFYIGFKGISGGAKQNFIDQVRDELLVDIIAGESSPLYRRLYDSGMINSTFGGEVFSGRDHISIMFAGESRDPKAVREAVNGEIRRIMAEGIDGELFELCKKAAYGRYIRMFDKPEAVASSMASTYFAGLTPYELPEIVAATTIKHLTERLVRCYDIKRSSLSVILPKN